MLIVHHGSPDHYGSSPKEILAYSRHFAVHVLCSNAREPAYAWPPEIAIERVGLGLPYGRSSPFIGVARWLDYLVFMRAVARRVRRIQPALVYAYDAPALVAVSLVRRRRDTFALVYHCLDQREIESFSRLSVRRWIERSALRYGPRAALVISLDPARSHYYMERSGDRREPLLLPNYPSLATMPTPADFEALIERRFVRRELLYTGIIGANQSLVEALQALDGAGARLTVYGTAEPGSVERLLELAARLGLGDRFDYRGFVPHAAMIAQTMEAAVGLALYKPVSLNLSGMASASNKLYEYAARGIPAIVPDTPSFRGALVGEDWVAFADPSDPASIAHALHGLLRDREHYARAARAARRAFEQRLNFERVAPAVVDRLLTLASRASVASAG